ncbi:hypothetical protein HN592_01770 [Candidatus Woesearchaeota archaeon]|jgi:hypothetical protein|nr:hypothetical protein [Candidatus Woesearchaeota archaeon]MBT4368590.1 hypothetical protein [Candidatus Woesearchaeota archaeon]MBT4713101.1 hypothetical protein [Candidatus Woesearchaeota archaeon]MBT6639023.1 hypothetical protein [Candidatus Woesearchaeota archaeon]MBT7134222.1 hypothetical protein [Candidatus Woesearchaeota archaeon]
MTTKLVDIELHAHLHFDHYSLYDVIEVMEDNMLDVLVPLHFGFGCFDEVAMAAKDLPEGFFKVERDELMLRVEHEGMFSYFLRGVEFSTQEANCDVAHMIMVGHDQYEERQPMDVMIDRALDKDALVILDHPFVDAKNLMKAITPEIGLALFERCKRYSGRVALEYNGYCIPWVRALLGGKDVNQSVQDLSLALELDGSNVPVVSGTDLHARTRRSLNALGTARTSMDVDTSSGRAMVDSLKQQIFDGSHTNRYQTVPFFTHLAPCWAIPHMYRKVMG